MVDPVEFFNGSKGMVLLRMPGIGRTFSTRNVKEDLVGFHLQFAIEWLEELQARWRQVYSLVKKYIEFHAMLEPIQFGRSTSSSSTRCVFPMLEPIQYRILTSSLSTPCVFPMLEPRQFGRSTSSSSTRCVVAQTQGAKLVVVWSNASITMTEVLVVCPSIVPRLVAEAAYGESGGVHGAKLEFGLGAFSNEDFGSFVGSGRAKYGDLGAMDMVVKSLELVCKHKTIRRMVPHMLRSAVTMNLCVLTSNVMYNSAAIAFGREEPVVTAAFAMMRSGFLCAWSIWNLHHYTAAMTLAIGDTRYISDTVSAKLESLTVLRLSEEIFIPRLRPLRALVLSCLSRSSEKAFSPWGSTLRALDVLVSFSACGRVLRHVGSEGKLTMLPSTPFIVAGMMWIVSRFAGQLATPVATLENGGLRRSWELLRGRILDALWMHGILFCILVAPNCTLLSWYISGIIKPPVQYSYVLSPIHLWFTLWWAITLTAYSLATAVLYASCKASHGEHLIKCEAYIPELSEDTKCASTGLAR